MICGMITGPSLEDILRQIRGAERFCQMIELRLDLWEDASFLEMLLPLSLPYILTCRRLRDGGAYRDLEESRYMVLENALHFSPNFIDLEDDILDAWIDKIRNNFPKVKIIRSFHEFILDEKRVEKLPKLEGDFYKLATVFTNTSDFLKRRYKHPHIDFYMGMGKGSEFTRVLAKTIHSKMVYAPIEKVCIEGQVLASEYRNKYSWPHTNETSIYGLIGNPLDKSMGYQFHNQFFQNEKIDAVYVNFPMNKLDLGFFISYIRERSKFKGLSVTSPLKEEILNYLDEISMDAKQKGAVNTIKIENGKLYGFNTDGLGALDVISPIEGKRVHILGAGGTAKAIALEAQAKGAYVAIYNRNKERLRDFANQFNLAYGALKDLRYCDIIINATSSEDPIEVLPDANVAFDVNYGNTSFLEKAIQKKMYTFTGKDLFIAQAKRQQLIWRSSSANNSLTSVT